MKALVHRLVAAARGLRRDETGAGLVEYMALGALGVAAAVVINGALTNLGLDIVDWARTQLGI
jgi:Flp pilus assembly pilin Flp